ncbi:putative Ig domain-containing protein, partial [Paraferrimonas sp. SM1919]|uniref:beta strand repeat-containing protein n=1 Tax=Paraferrimonas sp. SM1919 TaxID=2662263 RepID=UPI0013D30994
MNTKSSPLKKTAHAVKLGLPMLAALAGGIASARGVYSSSSRARKSNSIPSQVNHSAPVLVEPKHLKNNNSPFSAFSKKASTVPKVADIKVNQQALDFLKQQNLLNNGNLDQARISGSIVQRGRKQFADVCANQTAQWLIDNASNGEWWVGDGADSQFLHNVHSQGACEGGGNHWIVTTNGTCSDSINNNPQACIASSAWWYVYTNGIQVPVSNSAPTISNTPSSITAYQGQQFSAGLSAVVIGDADGGDVTLTFTASAGTLTASATTPGVQYLAGNSANFQMTGTPAELTTALDLVVYTAPSSGSSATLSFSVNDGTDTTSSGNITINITPLPAITSATYNDSTGVLVVTGTDFVSNSGAANDIDVSLLSIKGDGNASHTLTSTDVEISSATSFSVNLNSSDQSAVHALLNANGTQAIDNTVYNLSAADNWAAGFESTIDIADSTNAITVTNVDAKVNYLNSTPSLTSTGLFASTLNIEFDTTGKAYYVVVPSSDSAPSAAQVVAGNNASDSSAAASGSIDITSANQNYTASLSSLSHSTNYTVYVVAQDSAGVTQVTPTNTSFTTASPDSDADLTQAGTVSEPVSIPTSADTVGEAIDIFDFTLSDAGTSDNLTLEVSQVVINVTGTSSDDERSAITWRLNGADASNISGVYNASNDTITFSGLSISVADGASEIYTVNAYYNDNSAITHNANYSLSLDGDTDITTTALSTLFGSTTAVTTGTATLTDNIAPMISENTAVTSLTSDSTPDLVITNSEAGTLSVGGSCGSGNEGAITAGNTTITLSQTDNSSPLTDATYSDCTLSVTDAAGNVSNTLSVTSFTVDTQGPTVTNNGLSIDENAQDTVIGSSQLSATDTNSSAANISYTLTAVSGDGTLYNNATVLNQGDSFTQANINANNINFDHNGAENNSTSFSFSMSDELGNINNNSGANFDFTITVNNVNDAPTITGTPSTSVDEDSSYSFTPTGNDVDSGDTLTFAITGLPSWASFDTATGALTGTPTNDDVGNYSNIIISVTDGTETVALPSFAISVSNTNDAPTITGTPSTSVDEDSSYSFTPTGNDVDTGDTLTFAITGQPSWASFDTATGALTGTPTNDDVGNYSNIIISVTDGTETVALPSFA